MYELLSKFLDYPKFYRLKTKFNGTYETISHIKWTFEDKESYEKAKKYLGERNLLLDTNTSLSKLEKEVI